MQNGSKRKGVTTVKREVTREGGNSAVSLSLSLSFFFFLLFHRGGQKFETDDDVGDDTDARVRGEVREKVRERKRERERGARKRTLLNFFRTKKFRSIFLVGSETSNLKV